VHHLERARLGIGDNGGNVNDTPVGVDPTRPSPARLYDYFLGGTTNFAVDREAGERLKVAAPDLIDAVWANRGFHGRAAVWLATCVGPWGAEDPALADSDGSRGFYCGVARRSGFTAHGESAPGATGGLR
jgi:S-adenosyl methyltransferase